VVRASLVGGWLIFPSDNSGAGWQEIILLIEKRYSTSMNSEVAQAQTAGRSDWLDVLRGLAIVGVVAVHSIQNTESIVVANKSDFFFWVVSLGKYGVELFFFLSGWLLVSIYGINGRKLGKAYWARRMGRIYPLWILFMVIGFLRWNFSNSSPLNSPINPLEGQSELLHSTAGVIVLTLTFTLFISASLWNGVIPGGWSIQAEVAHYLLFPFMRNRSFNSVLKIVTFINLLTSLAFFIRPKMEAFPDIFLKIMDAWFRLSLYSTIIYFLIGMLSYRVFTQLKESRFVDLKLADFNITNNTILFFCISSLLVPCPFGNQVEAIGYISLMITFSFVILRNQMLSSIFRFLGKYAYFIYFMHFLALASVSSFTSRLNFTTSQLGAQQVVFALVFIYSLSVSSLLAIPSMKYFERPIIRIAHKVK
jgi:peptidoglycan/LPS O-acetylase OafA/YrhL